MSENRRRGTTLIEVLFGLVILSTLLAVVVMARGRFLRQAADAQRKAKLVAALDQQLERWFASTATAVPLNTRGTLDALPSATWSTRVRPSSAADSLNSLIVGVSAADTSTPPLHVDVDVLVHKPLAVTP